MNCGFLENSMEYFFSLLFLFFGFGLVVLQMSGGWLSKSLIEDDCPV
tara:strand:- start:495 stop:635 length:141 start_codon:yes stop_codon:yes gene_type:complete